MPISSSIFNWISVSHTNKPDVFIGKRFWIIWTPGYIGLLNLPRSNPREQSDLNMQPFIRHLSLFSNTPEWFVKVSPFSFCHICFNTYLQCNISLFYGLFTRFYDKTAIKSNILSIPIFARNSLRHNFVVVLVF